MSYTPTNWSTGDTITASALNKIEQGVANAGGGGTIVHLSTSGYASSSMIYGYVVYATYDNTYDRWVVTEDNEIYWERVVGYGNNPPRIIPPYLTILPNDNEIGLFFLNSYPVSASVTTTGDVGSLTTLYYGYGSIVQFPAYQITGNGSIHLDIS